MERTTVVKYKIGLTKVENFFDVERPLFFLLFDEK
jgi:hypothetical protein